MYDVSFQLIFFSVFAVMLFYQLVQRILKANEAGACRRSRRFLSVCENVAVYGQFVYIFL